MISRFPSERPSKSPKGGGGRAGGGGRSGGNVGGARGGAKGGAGSAKSGAAGTRTGPSTKAPTAPKGSAGADAKPPKSGGDTPTTKPSPKPTSAKSAPAPNTKTQPATAAKPKPAPAPKSGQKPVTAKPAEPKNKVSTGDKVTSPAKGTVSSTFGPRKDPVTGKPALHGGVDIKAPKGTRVESTGAGKVLHAGPGTGVNAKAGKYVKIDHGNGVTSSYLHMDTVKVKVGDTIKAGAQVGTVGSTGKSTGPHLHYQEKKNGKPRPPTFKPDKG